MKRKRDWLLRSLGDHVVPVFVQHGFTSVPLVFQGAMSREYKETFPPCHFIRSRENQIDFVEIQLAPYRADYFRINAGIRSIEGLVEMSGHQALDRALALWVERFEMLANPRFWQFWWWSWFTVRTWFREPTEISYGRLARRVAGYFSEVEMALHHKQVGRHMRRALIPKMKFCSTNPQRT